MQFSRKQQNKEMRDGASAPFLVFSINAQEPAASAKSMMLGIKKALAKSKCFLATYDNYATVGFGFR